MINLKRQIDFFNPIDVKDPVHIIGTGAVGSHVANALARLGIQEIILWDFDEVESHNIPNQMFTNNDIGKSKTEAVKEQLLAINPEINITTYTEYKDELLVGYVFACVDSIEVRRKIYEENEYNLDIHAVFDTRIGLDSGQVISADWTEPKQVENLLKLSQFKHEEVEQQKSACGTRLAVLTTVQLSALYAVTNFINFIKTKELRKLIIFNTFNFKTTTF